MDNFLLVVGGDAIYDGGAAVALGPGNAVNVFVVESELGLLGAVKGELDLDSPALLVGFDVQYDSDNVAYMDLSAGRKGEVDARVAAARRLRLVLSIHS